MFTLFHHHPQDEPVSSRERERWADNITSLLRDLDRPVRRFTTRSSGPIYRPEVVGPCAPALRQVREILRDPDAAVVRGDLHRLDTFLCEGAVSPLLGRNPNAARRTATELLGTFAAHAGRRTAAVA